MIGKIVDRATVTTAVCLMTAGCATSLTELTTEPDPPTETFGTFNAVELVTTAIAPAFAETDTNKKAASRIHEHLVEKLGAVFPNLTLVEDSAGIAETKTLVIRPVIKEIKFVGRAARFWVGALPGSSAVLMEVRFIDKQSGALVARPEFYRSAGAIRGALTVGATDNTMLAIVANDASTYAASNR